MDDIHDIDELEAQKKNIEQQIDDIQSTCMHLEKSLKHIHVQGNQLDVRYVCDDCHAVVGYPTPEEVKKFLAE